MTDLAPGSTARLTEPTACACGGARRGATGVRDLVAASSVGPAPFDDAAVVGVTPDARIVGVAGAVAAERWSGVQIACRQVTVT